MSKDKPDIKADISKLDRGEATSMMEPMILSSQITEKAELTDLVLDLMAKSVGLRRSLPSAIQKALADLVRSMNCYYSNLIEGHDTHPIAIEKALHGDYSKDIKKRNLQKEARAHILVQQWIDEGGIKDNYFSEESICDIHQRFYELLPEELLSVEDPESREKVKVIPGRIRTRDVKVGNHIAISPGAIPRFLKRYESAYSELSKTDTLLTLAAQHHRLLWIHPFLDGNGRVARLLSHAVLLKFLDTGGIWSVARGFARNVQMYKSLLANCDLKRRNDLDGRGQLSEESLITFTRFFLETCIDQVNFMESLIQPERLRARMLLWAEEEIRVGALPQQSLPILEALLYRGELQRGESKNILNVSDRQARRVTSLLIEKGVVTSDTAKSPLRLAFPATLASRFLPGLFPEK